MVANIMGIHAAISGWGYYVPSRVLTNAELEKLVDTNDDWICSRTGIRERRISGTGESSSSMATLAAQRALESAQIPADQIDLILFSSTTPDYLLPASACLIQQRLGAHHAAAFDLNAACTSFFYGLTVASQFIQAGTYRRILVIGSDNLTRFIDWQDRSTCVLFGDGAGAVVLEATQQNAGVLSNVLGSRGDLEKLLVIEGGGSARPACAESLAGKDHYIRMRGNDVFKLAVRSMAQASLAALAKAQLSLDDIRVVIPHQANLRIIQAAQSALNLPDHKIYINIDRFGNTGAASVAIALAEYLDTNVLHPGDNLLLVGFGGGLTWAANTLRWADLDQLRKARA